MRRGHCHNLPANRFCSRSEKKPSARANAVDAASGLFRAWVGLCGGSWSLLTGGPSRRRPPMATCLSACSPGLSRRAQVRLTSKQPSLRLRHRTTMPLETSGILCAPRGVRLSLLSTSDIGAHRDDRWKCRDQTIQLPARFREAGKPLSDRELATLPHLMTQALL